MKVALFDYDLPQELIAQAPAEPRDSSRLMILDRATGEISHRHFRDIGAFLRKGDLLVLNDTRVIPARVYGLRRTLGKVEALFLEEAGPRVWRALLGARGRIERGEVLRFADGRIEVEVEDKDDEGVFTLRIVKPDDLLAALAADGHIPLPPYIRRAGDAAQEAADRERYQTVYAQTPGAVAAPTAGLHFTDALMREIEAAGVEFARVTLHVGLGTFRPVKVDEVESHRMHREYYSVGREAADAINAAQSDGRRIVAVGTTTARVLETIPEGEVRPASGYSQIFIYPPYRFHRVNALITNFHLPKSTLLMMVSAFAGRERIFAAYEEAKRMGYRFYSYGDAMFIA